jgi:energy-converting hydrogenase A subunit M
MNITGHIWREDVIDKLAWKHQTEVEEFVDAFDNKSRVERLERGHRPGEDLYLALGQTDEGRYVTVFLFARKMDRL